MSAPTGTLPRQRGNLNFPLNGAPIVAIATTALCPIGPVDAETILLTGNTAIVSFGVANAGTVRRCRAADIFDITHSATDLFCPGGATITTAANDTFTVVSLGLGRWYIHSYQRATGSALVAGLSGFSAALNTASPNGTTNNSSLTASGGSTNQGVTVAWKGTAYLNLTIPDGTATGGNVPGSRSVDLQVTRAAAGNVAAMADSFQAATSNSSTTGGGGGQCANIAGTTLSTGGTRSLNTGLANASTGDQVFTHGGYGSDRGAPTCVVFGGNYTTTVGGIQTRTFELWTSSAFSAAARTLGGNGSSANIPILPDSAIGTIIAYVAMFAGTDYWMVKLEGICYRGAGVGTTRVNGVTTAIAGTVVYQTAGVAGLGWAVDMIADTTNGGVAVRTTGDTGQIVRSRCWFLFGELDP